MECLKLWQADIREYQPSRYCTTRAPLPQIAAPLLTSSSIHEFQRMTFLLTHTGRSVEPLQSSTSCLLLQAVSAKQFIRCRSIRQVPNTETKSFEKDEVHRFCNNFSYLQLS